MKIVLVLALVLGVALFPPQTSAEITPVECYHCATISGLTPSDKDCDKISKEDATFPNIKCESGLCQTSVDEKGKVIARGCFSGMSYNVRIGNATDMNNEGQCLMKGGINNCFSGHFLPKCDGKRRKRSPDGDVGDSQAAATPSPTDSPTAADSNKDGAPVDSNKEAGAAKSGGGSTGAREKALEEFDKKLGPVGVTCLCNSKLCNWDTKPQIKCYECTGQSTTGKEDKCLVLDTEKANTVQCHGTHCGIWKWKMPASEDGKVPGVTKITRGCVPVSNLLSECFKKHGEEIDKATCAITVEGNSETSYAKVDKCLEEKNPAARQSEITGLTVDQIYNIEQINCICEGDLCNESGKGSHLVLSNGVVMLGLMMIIARTGKLI